VAISTVGDSKEERGQPVRNLLSPSRGGRRHRKKRRRDVRTSPQNAQVREWGLRDVSASIARTQLTKF